MRCKLSRTFISFRPLNVSVFPRKLDFLSGNATKVSASNAAVLTAWNSTT